MPILALPVKNTLALCKEDLLDLGCIHIQVKRNKRDNLIGREDVQKFVGAMAVDQSNKGVFITTSGYSKGELSMLII